MWIGVLFQSFWEQVPTLAIIMMCKYVSTIKISSINKINQSIWKKGKFVTCIAKIYERHLRERDVYN